MSAAPIPPTERPHSIRSLLFVLAGLTCLSAAGPATQGPGPDRLIAVLPPDGLDRASILVFRDQRAMDPHYFLADETVLGLDGTAEALFARYAAGSDEALLLVIAYPSEERTRQVYERFGRQFFSGDFDPKEPRFLERIETGDYAAAARAGDTLIVVLEAPDRQSCQHLVDRAEAAVSAPRR